MKKLIMHLTLFVAAICATLLGLRVFAFDSFIVKGNSMEPTLHTGQRIWVNKMLMGPRLYTRFDFDSTDLHCIRLPGVRKIRVGDMVVFNHIYGGKPGKIGFRINYVFAKRCMGCPGDSVIIKDGRYVSPIGAIDAIPEECKDILLDTPDSLIAKCGVHLNAMRINRAGWTIKNFGPLYIPAKGDCITLDNTKSRSYYRIIEYETGIHPYLKGDGLLLGDKVVTEYTFCHDYYFLAGDNVLASNDSRYFGLVPDDYIIGIVMQ